jgi:lipoprotein-releasing system permease protein
MNTELFIARRIVSYRRDENRISRPIVTIAILGIALGLAAMIISTATVTGFKNQIRDKVIGFGSHIQILNFDSNTSYETSPVNIEQTFIPEINSLPGVNHIQVFATKAGIIKTEKEIQGVVLKGIGSDFDWKFLRENLVDGNIFVVTDTSKTNKVLISKNISDLLHLKVNDSFIMYFIQDPPRMRKFIIEGVYETSLEDFDKLFILADIGHIQKLNNWSGDQVSGFEISIDNFNDIEEMAWQIQGIVGFDLTENGTRMRIQSIIDKYPQIFDWLNLQDMNVWIILVLILLVAGFNMVSSLLILILERTNMIGILKALGTQNWSIRKIFLYQSAYLITKGMFWGNLIGIVLCLIQYHFGIIKLDQASYYLTEVPINIDLIIIATLNTGTLILTVLMLIIPSYLISRISPVKTIKFD